MTRLALGTLRDKVDAHHAEQRADSAELKAGISQIVSMLGALGEQEGGPRAEPS